jgi:hypothetical protein
MRTAGSFANRWMFAGSLLVLLAWWSGAPNGAQGQQGDNAVYNASSACCQASTAFIDATAFCAMPGGCTTSDDFCSVVNQALKTLPSTGGVVDARGVNPGANNTCVNSPFTTPNSITTPSTVLLPPGPIYIHAPWVMPNQTRISGEGRKTLVIACSSTLPVTPTNPCGSSNFNFDSTDSIIEMGSASLCSTPCTGVSIEHVLVEGNNIGPALTGIYNASSGDGSYVNDVTVKWLEGNGILASGANAAASGPYTNLDIEAGGSGGKKNNNNPAGPWGTDCTLQTTLPCEQTTTACVQLDTPTRGLHGITCTADGVPEAAIYVGANTNTVEDVHVEGNIDSIRVGDNALASGNTANAAGITILDITSASGGPTSGSVQTGIHICAPGSSTCSSNAGQVTDVSVYQTQMFTTFNKPVIQDDVTSTTLEGNNASPGIAEYELGQPLAGGNTRFAVGGDSVSASTEAPTWGVAALGNSTSPSGNCQPGTILSNTTGTSPLGNPDTIWVCNPSNVWKAIR